MNISQLLPFQGLHTSLIHFSSGYAFRISDWASTPTEYGASSNLWMVTAEDHRILFADPAASGGVVCIYHNFNEVHGASISINRPGQTDLRLNMQVEDGSVLEMNLHLSENLTTRLITAISRAMPTSLASRDPMISFADILMSKFIAKGKSKTAGHTDTGQSFFGCETKQLFLVKDGNSWLNETDLGRVCLPTRSIAFGDFESTPQAYVIVGTLYLPYEKIK